MLIRQADVEREVTLVIKTFERPTALGRLIESVRRFYPSMPVLVVDDSAQPLHPLPAGVTRYSHLPFNSGASFGRNFGLRQVETEYVLFADDDLVFGPKTDLCKMLRVLRKTAFDVVSCVWLELDPLTGAETGVKWFEGTTDVVDKVYIHRYGATRGYIDGFAVYDVVHDFFMADRERLGRDPWDPRLKIGPEHPDFFLTLKQRGLLCTRLRSACVYHYPERPAHYMRFRDNTRPYFSIFRSKYGIERELFVTEKFGKTDLFIHRCRRLISYAKGCVQRLGRLL